MYIETKQGAQSAARTRENTPYSRDAWELPGRAGTPQRAGSRAEMEQGGRNKKQRMTQDESPAPAMFSTGKVEYIVIVGLHY